MSDYKLISSQTDYQCPWFKIQKQEIKYPNNHQNTYFILKRPHGFVGIMAIENDKLIILKQWRPTIKDWLWEIPMGGIDDNEDSLQAAQREFLEETGYKAKSWVHLGDFYVGAGHSDQLGSFFLAQNLDKKNPQPQNNPNELIEVKQFSFAKIAKMIQEGEIKDGPTLAAISLYQLKFNKLI